MPRLNLVDPVHATGRTKELLDSVHAKLGLVPNLVRALASSPAALQGYLDLGGALAGAALPARLREKIALAVAEVNACGYCLSAHTAIGGKLGLTEAQILDARRGTADDPKAAAILRLAQRIVLERGHVRDTDLRAVREAGASDGEIAETVVVVALNVLTNWFNHVADTPIDFPAVAAGVPPAVAPGAGTRTG